MNLAEIDNLKVGDKVQNITTGVVFEVVDLNPKNFGSNNEDILLKSITTGNESIPYKSWLHSDDWRTVSFGEYFELITDCLVKDHGWGGSVLHVGKSPKLMNIVYEGFQKNLSIDEISAKINKEEA